MDLIFNIKLNPLFSSFCFVLGFAWLSYAFLALILNLINYIKFRSFLMSSKDRQIFYLIERNKELVDQKTSLQNQIDEITKNLIKNLQ
jgi:hypothetical protein